MGGEPQCWAEGRCLLFDDSFLHTAFHEGECLSAVAAFKYIHIYAYIYFNFISLELFLVSRKTEQKVQNVCPLMWPFPTRVFPLTFCMAMARL